MHLSYVFHCRYIPYFENFLVVPVVEMHLCNSCSRNGSSGQDLAEDSLESLESCVATEE